MNTHSAGACESLAELVDSLEQGGEGHSKAVARWATLIAIEQRLPNRAIVVVERAGMLHDVGKVELPRELLNKPRRLTREEFELVKQHTIIGARIAKALPSASDAAEAIEHHHERWDGKGYPHGKRGAETPIEGRILAVAEAFASMTRPSPYRPPFTLTQALDRLKWAAHAQLDPEIVASLVRVIERSIPSHMRDVHLNTPLESLISSEVSRLRGAFLGLAQQLLWIAKRLLGEEPLQHLTNRLNDAMREDGLKISIEGAQVRDEVPWVIGVQERAANYRQALWHICIALSRLFGETVVCHLVRQVAETLPEELQKTCAQYELHPALMQAA